METCDFLGENGEPRFLSSFPLAHFALHFLSLKLLDTQ